MKGTSNLFIYRPRYAFGDITFQSGDLYFFKYIRHRSDVDVNGILDIVAHGNPNQIQISHQGKDIYIDARTLAKLIKRNPQYKGKGIRLLSCNTGSTANGFAQNLCK